MFVNASSSSSNAELSLSLCKDGGGGGKSSMVGECSSALVGGWTLAGLAATGGGTLRLSGSAAGCFTEILTLKTANHYRNSNT